MGARIRLIVGKTEIPLNQTQLQDIEMALRLRMESAEENIESDGKRYWRRWYRIHHLIEFAVFSLQKGRTK